MTYECPLCGVDFIGALCHASCPISRGCAMVRCPRCAYEFVQEGSMVSFIRNLFGIRRNDDSSACR